MDIPSNFKFVPKHKALMTERIIDGVWYGGWIDDTPVITLNGIKMDARLVAKALNMALDNPPDKYYRKADHADLEQFESPRDHEDLGDGDGESPQ